MDCSSKTCDKPGVSQCAGCKSVRYCSPDCQREDWTQHKQVCAMAKKVAETKTFEKVVLVEGKGASPELMKKVSVHYTGTLMNGSKFDSSRDRNDKFEFTLGAGQVIKGWDQGVATMKQGEKSLFVIHPDYAYGARGYPPIIPPASILCFEVELF